MWRKVMRGMLDEVVAMHPPRVAVELDSLADLFYALTEGRAPAAVKPLSTS